MQAVILAAGEGTRMRPLTENKPKVMLPIANKPMLEHIIDAVKDAGIADILLIVGYRKESIMDYFGDGSKFGVRIAYISQAQQMGTGHAFGMASGYCKGPFIALNGDVLVSSSHIRKIMATYEDAVITVQAVEHPQSYGVIETDGPQGHADRGKVPRPPDEPGQRGRISVQHGHLQCHLQDTAVAAGRDRGHRLHSILNR